MVFKIHRRIASNIASNLWRIAVATLVVTACLGTAPAAAQTFFTPRAILADFFPQSQGVTYRKFELSAELRARLEPRLGYPLPKPSYTFYVAKTGERIDGYAIIDEEMGQHLPITFAVKFSPQGAVQRQEIMVYRERYGDEVRDNRFRQQFVGKTPSDSLRPGEDVVAVSGATISSRAMALGVRRSLLLLDELVLQPQRLQKASSMNDHAPAPPAAAASSQPRPQ